MNQLISIANISIQLTALISQTLGAEPIGEIIIFVLSYQNHQMANPNPNYPEEYTFMFKVIGFTANLPQFYKKLEDRLTEPIVFSNGREGRQIIQTESAVDLASFLIFIRYARIDGTVVTVFHRGSDLNVVGRQTGDGMAYILNNSCLEKTKACLKYLEIRFEMIEKLEDSYLSLESFAQVRRARILVGALGLDFALEAFSIDNPKTDLRGTAYGFLYFTHLVSVPFRIGPIRTRILNGFLGVGVEIPGKELQLEYAWTAISYLLSPCHFSSVEHFEKYTFTAIKGMMSSIELADWFRVIKQTSQEIPLHTDMGEQYAYTVDLFYKNVLLNHP